MGRPFKLHPLQEAGPSVAAPCDQVAEARSQAGFKPRNTEALQALVGWGVVKAPPGSSSDTPGQTPPLASPQQLTYGRCCGQPSRAAPFLAGHRPGHTPGGQRRSTSAPGHMCTESPHTGPQKAQGPPEGGSGRTPRHSSEAGTAPMGPAGMRGTSSVRAALTRPWLLGEST